MLYHCIKLQTSLLQTRHLKWFTCNSIRLKAFASTDDTNNICPHIGTIFCLFLG